MAARQSLSKRAQSTKPMSLKQALRQLRPKKDQEDQSYSSIFVLDSDIERSRPRIPSSFTAIQSTQPDYSSELLPKHAHSAPNQYSPLSPSFSLSQLHLSLSRTVNSVGDNEERPVLVPSPQHIPTVTHRRISTISLRPEKCTSSVTPSLKTKQSTLSIYSVAESTTPATSIDRHSLTSTRTVRKTRGSENLRRGQTNSPSIDAASTREQSIGGDCISLGTNSSSRTFASINSVDHFGSFCVLDTQVSGCPVSATSENLRYNLKIGERFHLNIQGSSKPSIDIVTGTGADGEELTYLTMFSPMVSLLNGSSRFVLASMVDVTNFIRDAASEPQGDSGPQTPISTANWSDRSYELNPDELLGGCSLPADASPNQYRPLRPVPARSVPDKSQSLSNDIWLSIAEEEEAKASSSSPAAPRPPNRGSGFEESPVMSSSSTTSPSTVVDDILSEFMVNLQKLYSDFFILARSPLDEYKYFEICNISPSLHADGEYVTGHLSHTPPGMMAEFSKNLGKGKSFRAVIKWGNDGSKKQCYCIPLYGKSSSTWLCLLVSMNRSILW